MDLFFVNDTEVRSGLRSVCLCLIQFKKGATTRKERKMMFPVCFVWCAHMDMHKHTHKTEPMSYWLAMATTLTTTRMSGDFPNVYINHHGNSFILCVRIFMGSGQSFVACQSQRLHISVFSWYDHEYSNLLNQGRKKKQDNKWGNEMITDDHLMTTHSQMPVWASSTQSLTTPSSVKVDAWLHFEFKRKDVDKGKNGYKCAKWW